MGAANINQIYASRWVADLTHRSMSMFVYMALVSADTDRDDTPARLFWGDRDTLAQSIGYEDASTDSAQRQVRKCLNELKTAGAITVVREGRRGSRANYRLHPNKGERGTAPPVDNSHDRRTESVPLSDDDCEIGGPKRSAIGGPKRSAQEDRIGPDRRTEKVPPRMREEERGRDRGTPPTLSVVSPRDPEPVDNGGGGTPQISDDEQAVIAAGIRPDLAAEALDLARRDPETTSPVGRIRASAQYRQQLTEQIDGERKRQRLEVLAAAERSDRGRCDHDDAGLLPTLDGKPRCPICRRAGATALALHDLTEIA